MFVQKYAEKYKTQLSYNPLNSRLLQLLENIQVYSSLKDSKVWLKDDSGYLSCKSYFGWLLDDPLVSNFGHFSLVWKSAIPNKIRAF